MTCKIISGTLTGRFYDKNGKETAYMMEFYNKIKQCEVEKEASRKEDQKYPPCNISWSAEEGTKVWCTTTRFLFFLMQANVFAKSILIS